MAFNSSRATPAGLAAALRALRGASRKPHDGDRPPASTFPGRQPRRIDGQLSLGEEARDGN